MIKISQQEFASKSDAEAWLHSLDEDTLVSMVIDGVYREDKLKERLDYCYDSLHAARDRQRNLVKAIEGVIKLMSVED